MENYEIIIIGGGPAGLAAAVAAYDSGIKSVLVLERDHELGGILNQCIHNGFGLHTFREELTGPEYASRYIEEVKKRNIEFRLDTMVLEIHRDKTIQAVNKTDGLFELQANAIILAMGCRERARGSLNIPGYRPAGVFSAGTAQRLVNMENYMPGKEVVILGSGDIGLIMARRMTLEGAKVKLVAELMPYSGGLKRNIVQCLDDYGIPLKLSHTVIEIHGKERLTGVTIAEVDQKGKPIAGTEEYYSCDTLLLSVGLIPENELSKGAGVELDQTTNGPIVNESLETNVEGIFACGNVLHVHDLVDYVSQEATQAGKNAATYVSHLRNQDKITETSESAESSKSIELAEVAERYESAKRMKDSKSSIMGIPIISGPGVRYTVPKTIRIEHMQDELIVRFRVANVYRNCYISAYLDGERIQHKKRPVLAPGEMEDVKLSKVALSKNPNLSNIIIQVEEA